MVSELCEVMSNDPANENWIHIADALAIRALRRWLAWCDHAKLAEEGAALRAAINVLTGEAAVDGHTLATTVNGSPSPRGLTRNP